MGFHVRPRGKDGRREDTSGHKKEQAKNDWLPSSPYDIAPLSENHHDDLGRGAGSSSRDRRVSPSDKLIEKTHSFRICAGRGVEGQIRAGLPVEPDELLYFLILKGTNTGIRSPCELSKTYPPLVALLKKRFFVPHMGIVSNKSSQKMSPYRPLRLVAALKKVPRFLRTRSRVPIIGRALMDSYLGRLTQTRLLTPQEEVELVRAAHLGDQGARDRLVEANMRLVINIARGYVNSATSLEDLVQEGCLGLIRAIERFDPERGLRFSTYATFWVRQAISRSADTKARTIRLPGYISQGIRKLQRAQQTLTTQLGREPTAEELVRATGMNLNRVITLQHAASDLVSLDMQVNGQDRTTLGNILADEGTSSPDQGVLDGELRKELLYLIGTLTEPEREVLRYHLGLKEPDKGSYTTQLSRDLEMSRSQVRDMEASVIRKLRVIARRRRLLEQITG